MVDGQRLRALRKAHKLSQKELAGICGVTQTAISKIEKEKADGTIETLRTIATTLGTTIDGLLKD